MVDWDVWGLRVGAFFGVFVCTSVFGLLPLVLQRYIPSDSLRDRLLSLGNSFAGGLFLGSGFVHLLGEASHTLADELGETYESYPLAMILAPLGFLGAFFVEKVMLSGWHSSSSEKKYHTIGDEEDKPYGTFVASRDSSLHVTETTADNVVSKVPEATVSAEEDIVRHRKQQEHHHHHHDHHHDHHHHHHHHDQESKGGGHGHDDHDHSAHMLALMNEPNAFLPYILVIVLSFHSIFSGLAVGVQRDASSALPVFVAIISHKWIEAFALGVSLLRANAGWLTFLKLVVGVFSMTTPIGILIGVALASVIDGSAGNIVTAIFTALAAGTFIYVAVVDILVPEFATERDKWVRSGLVLLGMSMITMLIFVFNDHGHGNDDELDHGDEDHDHDHAARSVRTEAAGVLSDVVLRALSISR